MDTRLMWGVVGIFLLLLLRVRGDGGTMGANKEGECKPVTIPKGLPIPDTRGWSTDEPLVPSNGGSAPGPDQSDSCFICMNIIQQYREQPFSDPCLSIGLEYRFWCPSIRRMVYNCANFRLNALDQRKPAREICEQCEADWFSPQPPHLCNTPDQTPVFPYPPTLSPDWNKCLMCVYIITKIRGIPPQDPCLGLRGDFEQMCNDVRSKLYTCYWFSHLGVAADYPIYHICQLCGDDTALPTPQKWCTNPKLRQPWSLAAPPPVADPFEEY